jgi:hypothetical protein
MFSNIYIYVYTICTKYFDKNNGYSTEYPWIKVDPPLMAGEKIEVASD